MMRRSHRKSRNGCLECKKRHIKCDETRPQCINCTTVERDCQYPRPLASAAGRSPSDRSASPQMAPALDPSATAPSAAPTTLLSPTPVEDLHSRVNMVHMELLYHYVTQTAIYPLMVDNGMKDLIMTTALREPYVMYSVLALSAHHLGVRRPERQAFYHTLAIQLQTDALSLFNSIDVRSLDDAIEKRIPVFIFSCVIGFIAFCDTLTHRDADFDAAHARFVTYLRLHRGIHAVMHGYWEQLKETELRPIFVELVPQWYQVTGEGRECDEIRDKVRSLGLDPEETEAALRAIDLVQWVLDARPMAESRAYVLCSWIAMLGRPFAAMLEQGRPEALAVLTYFFLALHYCRRTWIFGDSGQHLLTLYAEHFRGGEWFAWVETPYRMLRESLESEASNGRVPAENPHDQASNSAAVSHSDRVC